MGTLITIVLAVIIFGVGLGVFYKTLKKEAVEGTCSSCGHKGSCGGGPSQCSTIKTIKFEESPKK